MAFSKDFDLKKNILTVDSSQRVSISLTSDADVLLAIGDDTEFPKRDNGIIDLAHISLEADAGKKVAFKSGGGSVTFNASAGFRTGMGVFDKAADALKSLQVEAVPQMDLSMPAVPDARHLLMLWGYSAEGSVNGSHPIGALGTVTFGVEGSRNSLNAVLHTFPAKTGARTAIAETVSSWCLPRHFAEDPQNNKLDPGTWLISEVDGSFKLNLGATLGYDFNFVREFTMLGISRSLGAKIDAGLTATFGFEASGKYLLVLGRESQAEVARLRLFKQKNKGISFGLNLNVGITGQANLPRNVDEVVEAVFGVHGQQVLKDLHEIEDWLDKNKDLSDTVAGLVNETGLKLLQDVTGLNPKAEFDKARGLVLDALKKWDALPAKTSAALWKTLKDIDADKLALFKKTLTTLADPDKGKRAKALAGEIANLALADSPLRQFLTSFAEQGLLALSEQLEEVQQVSAQALDILNGGVIKKLQDFIAKTLDLQKIRDAVTKNDFDALDGWLVKRMSAFLDEKFGFEQLDTVKKAIEVILSKRQEFYDKALKALKNRYSVEFAFAYQKNTTSTALMDVEFDYTVDAARQMLKTVVVDSNLDTLFVNQVPGVTFRQAMMTHEIKQNTSVQLHMPFFNFSRTHVNESLASIKVEENAGRVLVYELSSKDKVTVENRFKSELSILGGFRTLADGSIELARGEDKVIAYESVQVRKNMKLADFEHRVTPFIEEYLADLFPGGPGSLNTFYVDLDRMVENVTHNGTNEFGDVGVSMQLAMPADVLGSWLRRRTKAELKRAKMDMSRRIQSKFKQLLPAYFFQDTEKFRPNPTVAALMAWAAIPPSTSVKLDGDRLTFNTDEDVFWNFPDPRLRSVMATNSVTRMNMVPAFSRARDRLREIGDLQNAEFFSSGQEKSFQRMVTSGQGAVLLEGLVFTEAEIVDGATKALEKTQEALQSASRAPSETIRLLAEFGARFTSTFNEKVSSVYGGESLRTLGSMIFLEASAAIDPEFRAIKPRALLGITVMKEDSKFELAGFLKGDVPKPSEVAVTQNLVSSV